MRHPTLKPIAYGLPEDAMSDGHTSLLLPPTFISCTPSVQHLMTWFSAKVAGSPRWIELSNTLPFGNVP